MRLSLTLVATLLLTSACGVYFNAARNPIRVTAAKEISASQLASPDAANWTVEAKSSKVSFVSGRNNLTLKATISSLSPNRVEVLVLLASTTKMNTNPENFYVHLDGGDGWVDVDKVELGRTINLPYNYNVTVPVTVEAGMLRFKDGSTAKIYQTEMQNQLRQEQYYTRSAKLVFASEEVFKPGADKIVLRLRDLGINMSITWNISGDQA